jgi:hypothetical protein
MPACAEHLGVRADLPERLTGVGRVRITIRSVRRSSQQRGLGGTGRRAGWALQAGKACRSRTAISFSTNGTGSGSSIPKRKAPDEIE